MSAGRQRITASLDPSGHSALYWTLADTLAMAKRQLMRIPRAPDELTVATVEPVLIVVAFRYIFGGAIPIAGTSYVNYMMGGMLVMAAMFGSYNTGIGMVTDLQRGLVDRFRSLPMARSAVLTGRVLADLLRSAFIILVVWVVGLLVGFRPAGTAADWAAAVALLLLCSFTPHVALDVDGVAIEQRGGRPIRPVDLAVPADLHQRRVRPRPAACPTGCARSPSTSPSRSSWWPSEASSQPAGPDRDLAGRGLARGAPRRVRSVVHLGLRPAHRSLRFPHLTRRMSSPSPSAHLGPLPARGALGGSTSPR